MIDFEGIMSIIKASRNIYSFKQGAWDLKEENSSHILELLDLFPVGKLKHKTGRIEYFLTGYGKRWTCLKAPQPKRYIWTQIQLPIQENE